jgi:hypothetical protein
MNKILWASMHAPTIEQVKEIKDLFKDIWGSVPKIDKLVRVNPELFGKMSDMKASDDPFKLSQEFLNFCKKEGYEWVYQPAGSPVFQGYLGYFLAPTKPRHGDNPYDMIRIFYAFSERVSQDIQEPDGSIKKVSTFKHIKFQQLCAW